MDAGRSPKLDLGRTGEDAALAHYRNRGYRLIARNWRCSLGELDLVLARGATVVFCEVKTRRGSAFGGPHESVHHRKQHKLRLLAQAYLAAHPTLPEEVRFDVAGVTLQGKGPPSVHVFEDAF